MEVGSRSVTPESGGHFHSGNYEIQPADLAFCVVQAAGGERYFSSVTWPVYSFLPSPLTPMAFSFGLVLCAETGWPSSGL